MDEHGILSFVKELERLKDITRTAWTKEGRRESVAEHSWRLAVFVLALEKDFPDVDCSKAIRMCLIHDLGEAYEGDVSAKEQVDQKKKLASEKKALQTLLLPLSEAVRDEFINLWQEYNQGKTKEAKLVKAVDKMETIIQHNQGRNPSDFDYVFNLDYGKEYTRDNGVLKSMREILDQETKEKISQNMNTSEKKSF